MALAGFLLAPIAVVSCDERLSWPPDITTVGPVMQRIQDCDMRHTNISRLFSHA